MSAATPVIAIDGPSASGKGTVAQRVAAALGWHYLDSGALYRLVALAALRAGVDWTDMGRLVGLAERLDARFAAGEIFLGRDRVTDAIRTEECSTGASRVAGVPEVRAALLAKQRAFRQPPGLVAEGRDMGSIVFPDAGLKVFLTASAEVRAERRLKQLIEKGIPANIQTLVRDLRERDARDAERPVAPLRQLPDARLLDTTTLGVDEAVAQVLAWQGERASSR
ncbi:MAG: (d)CMP kinase [Burkholderiales bacterium]|nr:(d)CMP kinase [Burkholderiales bacterium]